jgi:hypothetical protein
LRPSSAFDADVFGDECYPDHDVDDDEQHDAVEPAIRSAGTSTPAASMRSVGSFRNARQIAAATPVTDTAQAIRHPISGAS